MVLRPGDAEAAEAAGPAEELGETGNQYDSAAVNEDDVPNDEGELGDTGNQYDSAAIDEDGVANDEGELGDTGNQYDSAAIDEDGVPDDEGELGDTGNQHDSAAIDEDDVPDDEADATAEGVDLGDETRDNDDPAAIGEDRCMQETANGGDSAVNVVNVDEEQQGANSCGSGLQPPVPSVNGAGSDSCEERPMKRTRLPTAPGAKLKSAPPQPPAHRLPPPPQPSSAASLQSARTNSTQLEHRPLQPSHQQLPDRRPLAREVSDCVGILEHEAIINANNIHWDRVWNLMNYLTSLLVGGAPLQRQ